MSALTILAEECELLNDSKYRSYISQVDKALKNFEYTSEWADLISALGKLNKVLVGHTKYPVIPKRVTIGKRLAQCLHPALPSGVHLKALETYDIIFKCIGTQRLAQDLFIYSAGLFPLLGHAAMSVKPSLLTLYERHFIALGKHIKPGLNGLLLGLLPGLEEGSEFHDRTNLLLEDFCQAANFEYFYTCLWECVLSCPSVRLPAITYLLLHYNKKKTMEDQLYMMGLNIDLMVEAVCSAIQDVNVLVQRSLLDFLLLAFPMHNGQLTKADMGKIVKAVVNVVLRRDMSLNRRLYSWLLGTGVSPSVTMAITPDVSRQQHSDNVSTSSETDLSYFYTFSQDLLIHALKLKLSTIDKNDYDGKGNSGKLSILNPFRILMSLLDKPEIGPVILESVLLSVFRCLYRECESYQHSNDKGDIPETEGKNGKRTKTDDKESKTYGELIKTSNLLFGAFEPYFIWDYIARMFETSCQEKASGRSLKRSTSLQETEIPELPELCTLVDFLLDVVSLETFLETQTEHLPDLLFRITTTLNQHCDYISDADIKSTLKLCTKLLSKVQPSMNVIGVDAIVDDDTQDAAVQEVSINDIQILKSKQNDIEIIVKETSDFVEVTKSDGSSSNLQKKTETNNNNGTADTTEIKQVAVSKEKRSSTSSIKSTKKGLRTAYPLNLIQACVEQFQVFFHTFVSRRILQDDNLSAKCLEMITVPSGNIKFSDSDSLLDSDSFCSYEDAPSSHIYDQLPLSSCQLSEERIHTFKSACKLLLDFSSVPIFCTDFQKVLKRTESKDEETVPVWLQDLIACICVVSNFEVQSTATASMLDLILLCQTVQSQSENKDEIDHSKSSTGGTVSVVILPALPPRHLKYLGDHTVFYKTLAQILWDYLDSSTPCHHRRSVELFHLLHQVAPSAWICEDVIGNSLVMDDQSARIEAFKRFTILWHLTRESKVEVNPGHSSRTFDRSMFVVLDSLKEDCSPVKTITSTWLTHLIQRSDISRVLDPILQMILHPDTARVSVQHVNIHKPRKVQISESSEDSSEARIYAISSSAGNVIYHVASERKKYRGRSDTEFVSHSIVMNEKGSTSTAPDNSLVNEELIFEKVKPDDLNLRINPWGSESSIDRVCDGIDLHLPAQQADLGSAKRLDKETCTKEGIFFDSEESSLKSEEVELTAQDIVQDILDMIVDRVVELDENDELDVANDDQKDSEVGLTGPSNNPVNLVSRSSSVLEDQDLLNSIDRREMDIDSLSSGETDVNPRVKDELTENTNIHPLHMHMLLYTQKFDCRRTSYALTTLKSMLVTCPRLVVTAMVTTSISAVRPSQLAKLQMLLSRHRKSVFGNNFYGELTPDVMSSYRSNMFIEILISICLYFVRSYYPNLMVSKMSQEELHANKEVHILATEVLTLLISELIVIMKESGKSFMSYIKDLLNRCKLQKALLHCCLATVFNSRKKNQRDTVSMVTEAIVEFNEDNLDPSANETFQIRLLNLLLAVIILEGNVEKIQGDVDPVSPTVSTEWERPKVNFHQSLLNAKFLMNKPIVQQGMFMSCVLSALKQKHLCHLHRHWIAVVTSSLPYMGKSLTNIIMSVVSQLCRNLESFAATYERNENDSTTNLVNLPPDHIVTLLEGLTTLCHYCLLDNLSPVSVGMVGLPAPSITNITPDTGSAGQILTNLIHVFNPISGSRETSPQRDAGPSPVLEARRGLLSIMPRIIACMTSMWKAVKSAEQLEEGTETWIMGNPKVIKQCILEFVSPISLPHGTHLLGAVGVAWNDRRKKIAGPNKKVLSGPCEEQLLLVHLVRDIKVLPTDTLVQTVTKVLKQPPATEMDRGKKGIALEVNMLQFFFAYVQHTPVSQLIDSWSSLLTLLRDGMQLNLSPPGKFILLQILNEFVQKMPMLDDKKNQKDLQDITQRLLEMVSMIAGSSLEQTTWLRRNLAVKPGPQKAGPLEIDEEDISESDAYEKPAPTRKERRDIDPKLTNAIDSKYSVQALVLLAELTSPLLDVVYTSDEKDKVAPFLVTILYNVFPYLRNHSYHNVPSFRACSQILNSISGYQYTRKAWRKEALELLLDSSFFQMDVKCIGYWRSIIDNLMTHDKTTFKDLMNRVTITQSGSLNLFSSKEQELEQKAQMLKRLAFTIFCSDPDQYQKCMPEIQERLADSLRVPHQAPSIMAQVFLCVRVLILRMSVHQLTSLWPTVITEMVHVFMQIEQELSNDTDEFKTQIQRIAALDSSWAHLGNGFNAHNNPAWLQLYLSVCKLLDLALALPADVVPQFQLYRWAFIGGVAAGTDSDREEDSDDGEDDKKNEKKKDDKKKKHKQPKFTPHIIRLAKLVNEKVRGATPILKQTPGRPLLTQTYLRSLVELQPFFNTLCFVGQSETNFNMTSQSVGRTQDKKSNKKKSLDVSGQTLMSKSKSSPAAMDKLSIGPNDGPSSKQYKSNISFIEEMIERDFLEPLPKY